MYFRFKYYMGMDRHVMDAMKKGDADAWITWLSVLHPTTDAKNNMRME